MERVSNILERLSNLLLILFMILLGISTTLQVVSRFVIRSPLVWTEEVSRMSFIWIAFLGSTVAVKHQKHMALDFLFAKLAPRPASLLRATTHIMMGVVAVVFLLAGWEFVLKNVGRISETTGVPMILLYIAAQLSGGLMLFYLVEQAPALCEKLRDAWRGKMGGKKL